MKEIRMFKHGNIIKEVSLKVKDLDYAVQFYNDILNVSPTYINGKAIYNITGSRFILVEKPNAASEPIGAPGLYHIAFTVNDIGGLKTVLTRILRNGYLLLGTADHGFTYAIYTLDPSGNGVEIYWDKPNYNGSMKTAPLPIETILSWNGFDEYKTSIGHIHLKVGNLEDAEEFFSHILGMDVTFRNYPGALFFSYSGYHHHIGTNIWETYHVKASKKNDKEYIGIEYVVLQPPSTYNVAKGTYTDQYGNKFIVEPR